MNTIITYQRDNSMNMGKVIVRTIVILSFAASSAFCDNSIIGFGGGSAHALGEGSEYWKTGFNMNGELFQKVSEYTYFGVRASFNRWSPDQSKVENDLTSEVRNDYWYHSTVNLLDVHLDGSFTTLEIIPSFKFITKPNPDEPSQLFGQLGAGMYFCNADIKATARVSSRTVTVKVNETENRIGVNGGVGLIIGGKVTKLAINSMFHLVFTDDEWTKYININLNILFCN